MNSRVAPDRTVPLFGSHICAEPLIEPVGRSRDEEAFQWADEMAEWGVANARQLEELDAQFRQREAKQ